MKLSKREIVMLVVLLVLAIVFIEYRFVVVPGLARLEEKKAEQSELAEKVSQIKLNLATIDVLKKTLEDNVADINSQSRPFYDGLQPDSLLDLSRTMILRNGLEVYEYTANEQVVLPIELPDTSLQEMAYQLKNLAKQYKEIRTDKGEEPVPTPTENPSQPGATEGPVDELELYQVSISVLGNYDQVRSLLADIESQNRAIRVNDFTIIVNEIAGKLDITMTLEFYGITWLFPESARPLESWPRQQVSGGVDNPYLEVTPMPSETIPTTTESDVIEP